MCGPHYLINPAAAASRWTIIVLRETRVFVSSLDVFLQLFCASETMVGEDLYCSSGEVIERDFMERSMALGGTGAFKSNLTRLPACDSDLAWLPAGAEVDFKSVLPAGQLPRLDAYEWNYSAQHAGRGEAEPQVGRPVWDLHQNCLKSAREDSDVPTVLPGSTLYSSLLGRPATAEEHLFFQGLIFTSSGRLVISPPPPRPHLRNELPSA